ncbi:MAG: Membrane protein metalloendopeptidase [Parcubacteria group bacterium GW2011_GWD2_38_12]|nr:MAG: Membrane protein metalloendopeptidase [Parcubacteria group bacterium GW2011_GWC2_36_17]KKQ43623.1 MAG: Membrane protein metalloendopeptidase [Parcubacteria group bacterium GW2011_GWE2_37_8]KKQ51898.1 MAG: Membrane protein metalloendopeptidase [Parcubacteria group bacterium GW2011_GWD2_38_12]KKQ59419.1 MAG: Membrane protein metalloendopeptidase [Parcubacteria group bacterium GW2011_GWD1_38_16]
MEKSLIKTFVSLICAVILFSPAYFGNASLIDDLKKQITQKEQELKILEEKSKQYKNTVTQSQKEQKNLKNNIVDLNTQIGYLATQIEITQNQLDQTMLFIEKLKAEITKQEESLQIKKIYISSAIQTINEYDEASLLELLLKNNTFSNFLNQTEYMKSLESEIQNNVDALQLLKSRLEEKHFIQKNKEKDLEELNSDLSSKKIITNQQKNKKESLLQETKNQEKKYSSLLSEIQKKRDGIQKEIYELEEKLKYTIDPSKIPAPRRGLFNWPANGTISQKWGSTSETGFINDSYKFHNGVDIAALIGTPIYAPADGKVIAIGDNGQYAYGKWIAIDHQNGLITLYGHLSLQLVSLGAPIKNGQKIGYMGSTGFSTGSHLHFTVYAENTFQTTNRWFGLLPLGGSINPFNYLPN